MSGERDGVLFESVSERELGAHIAGHRLKHALCPLPWHAEYERASDSLTLGRPASQLPGHGTLLHMTSGHQYAAAAAACCVVHAGTHADWHLAGLQTSCCLCHSAVQYPVALAMHLCWCRWGVCCLEAFVCEACQVTLSPGTPLDPSVVKLAL